jgi:hypothetical protein
MIEAEMTYKTAVVALETAQRALGATPRVDLEARAVATKAVEAAMSNVRESKEALKADVARRNFAGCGNTPLFLACAERFDTETVAALETRALEIQSERERVAQERRAKKEAAAAPSPPPKPPQHSNGRNEPEVIVRRAARADP